MELSVAAVRLKNREVGGYGLEIPRNNRVRISRVQLLINSLKSLRHSIIECRETKTKIITLANHKAHKQSGEPIKTTIKYMKLARSGGKRE